MAISGHTKFRQIIGHTEKRRKLSDTSKLASATALYLGLRSIGGKGYLSIANSPWNIGL